MNTERITPQKQNLYKAMWYLMFSTEKFIVSAAKNSMAFELEKEEYQRKLAEGKYSFNHQDHISPHPKRLRDLRILLLKTTGCIFSALILITLIGFYTGVLNIGFPIPWKNLISAFGIVLISWSTLFQLGWGNSTWSGACLDELVRHSLFRHVFIIVTFLSLLYFVLPE